MPSAIVPDRRASSPEENDNQDYDRAVDDFMRDLEYDNGTTTAANMPHEPAKDIDEEVQVKKKRKPNPKLDEARLLSQNGLPKLRRITKSKLKFRGKGHEYTDITTLLNMYQLWLDDLYPRAKFKDGLVMVEKVGHSKRMQVMRKAWLDSTKPRHRDQSPERIGDGHTRDEPGDAETGLEQSAAAQSEQDGTSQSSDPPAGSRTDRQRENESDAPDEDELDALLNGNDGVQLTATIEQQPPSQGPFAEDSDPEEDELDALFAEQDASLVGKVSGQPPGVSKVTLGASPEEDNFADEEEVMASMDW